MSIVTSEFLHEQASYQLYSVKEFQPAVYTTKIKQEKNNNFQPNFLSKSNSCKTGEILYIML